MRTDLHGWHICRTFWVCRERVSTCSEKCILCRDRIAKFGRTTLRSPGATQTHFEFSNLQIHSILHMNRSSCDFLCPSRRPAKRTAKVRQPDQSRHKNIPCHIWCTILDNPRQSLPGPSRPQHFEACFVLGPGTAVSKGGPEKTWRNRWEIGDLGDLGDLGSWAPSLQATASRNSEGATFAKDALEVDLEMLICWKYRAPPNVETIFQYIIHDTL